MKSEPLPARHISQSIARPVADVYAFASHPENLPKWAAGLAGSEVKIEGDHWTADSPMGRVKIRFAPKNDFGVLDHEVTTPDGKVFHNPLRVLKNESGSEVVFTLYRQPEVSDADYEKDAGRIVEDLATLKKLLTR